MIREVRVPIEALGKVSSYRLEEIQVDLKLYSIDTVKKVCYKFSDRYFSDLILKTDNQAVVQFRVPDTITKESFAALKADFAQELIDQDLRNKIFNETRVTRNLILTNAFSNTKLIND